jgi:alcohol dehydrogenase class IV
LTEIIKSNNLDQSLLILLQERIDNGRSVLLLTYKKYILNLTLENRKIKHLNFSTPVLIESEFNLFAKEVERFAVFDTIIAIGGGTILDLAKILKLKFIQQKPEIELILVPSTAGTGAEATRFAVMYDDLGNKLSIENEGIIPNIIIHAPEILLKVDKKFRAVSGFDAFSQSLESLWSCRSTDESKRYAKKSLKLLMENFEDYVLSPNATNAQKMQLAAYYSGKAINISYTTLAHALSYNLTYRFKIHHGLAVFLFLPIIINYNFEVTEEDLNDSRGIEYVRNNFQDILEFLNFKNANELSLFCTSLFNKFNLSSKLDEYGMTLNDVEKIVSQSTNNQRYKNNPRNVNAQILIDLINKNLFIF